ncbi:EAP30-like protein, partial [Cynara cardunculus var. scolymus]
MCAKVGVDPLASNKGFWAGLLGIGDFYYELGMCLFLLLLLGGVQIVDVCLATRPHNRGVINLDELCKLLSSEDDCLRAIGKLKVLGSGFEVITVGKRKLACSVPNELKKDHNEILELSQGPSTHSLLKTSGNISSSKIKIVSFRTSIMNMRTLGLMLELKVNEDMQ